jgi:hypothetical protein
VFAAFRRIPLDPQLIGDTGREAVEPYAIRHNVVFPVISALLVQVPVLPVLARVSPLVDIG